MRLKEKTFIDTTNQVTLLNTYSWTRQYLVSSKSRPELQNVEETEPLYDIPMKDQYPNQPMAEPQLIQPIGKQLNRHGPMGMSGCEGVNELVQGGLVRLSSSRSGSVDYYSRNSSNIPTDCPSNSITSLWCVSSTFRDHFTPSLSHLNLLSGRSRHTISPKRFRSFLSSVFLQCLRAFNKVFNFLFRR